MRSVAPSNEMESLDILQIFTRAMCEDSQKRIFSLTFKYNLITIEIILAGLRARNQHTCVRERNE